MATVPLTTPYAMKAATLYIGADDHTAAVSGVKFDPSTSTTEWTGIGGNSLQDQTIAKWTGTLDIAQDLAPASTLRYLHEHEGDIVDVLLIPVADGPGITATVVLSPGTIGGSADGNTATATITLAVRGKPQFVDDPVPPTPPAGG